jgi:predicted small secreted protein
MNQNFDMKTKTNIAAIALLAVASAFLSGCAGACQDLHDGQGPRGILGVPLAVSMPAGAAMAQAGAQIETAQAIERASVAQSRADIIRSMQPQRVDVYLH